jgi:hypothetical protein
MEQIVNRIQEDQGGGQIIGCLPTSGRLLRRVEALATKHGKPPLTLHTLRHVCQSVMTAKQLDGSDESAELRS